MSRDETPDPNAPADPIPGVRRNGIEPLYAAETIAREVAALGERLDRELPADVLLVSLVDGSLIFLADLVRSIPRSVRYELLHVGSGLGSPEAGGDEGALLTLHYPVDFSVRGESLLLLKDVVASGVIETYLVGQLRRQGAREVRIAALVDKPEERKTDLEVDYEVFSDSGPGTLVGYGLKYRGSHGNLPYIGLLTRGNP
jgi:hypoxanthine phosphoribosyltransferase